MPTWPSSLPAPAINTYRETPPQNTIRTQMDKGPPKLRRRTTANVRPISFTLRLTAAEVDVLDAFFVTDVYSGALSFDYTHPRTGASVTAQFTSEPQYGDIEGTLYNVGIELEILP